MKKLLLVGIAAALSLSTFAQSRPSLPSNWRNISIQRKMEVKPLVENPSNSVVLSNNGSKILTDLEIGTTTYDVQTNDCMDSRCYLFPDGTVGATFTFGVAAPSWPERGTGYNYYDGTAWLPDPTARIETIRTGWPSYAPLGPGEAGEVVVSHSGSTNSLYMNTRPVKGTGAWTQTAIPKAAGNVLWPRICTSGNTIHILANDNDTNIVLNGMKAPTYYYRSQDGGATWDINQVVPAGLETYTSGFGGDQYAWAKPQGNTIAFVIGEQYSDIVLMKSTDAGTTWTKTIVFDNPIPSESLSSMTFPSTDTAYVSDGHLAVELDPSGNAHVVFGTTRMLWAAADGSYNYFPVVNGLCMWNEGDPTISGLNGLNTDDLYNQGKLVAWVQDRNGDNVVFDNYVSGTTIFAHYGTAAPVSLPQISIDSNGDIFIVYTSAVEDQLDATSNCYYNHLWGRKYSAALGQWGLFRELTPGNPGDYDYTEQTFPSLSKTMDNLLHIIYMYDLIAGAYVEPFASPGTIAGSQNVIMYLTLDKSDLLLSSKNTDLSNSKVNIYPNPVTDFMDVDFSYNKSTPVTMNIYNAVGSLVKTEKFTSERGNATHINTKDLSTGIYLVKFETLTGTFSKKIIKN